MGAGVRGFFEAGKPADAIWHPPLIEAGVSPGTHAFVLAQSQDRRQQRRGTSRDEEVVRDGILVRSRKPDDLPAFNAPVVTLFAVPTEPVLT